MTDLVQLAARRYCKVEEEGQEHASSPRKVQGEEEEEEEAEV